MGSEPKAHGGLAVKRMAAYFRSFPEKALNQLLPPRCIVSGQAVDRQGMLAPEVWASFDFITAPYCDSCGVPFEFDTATGGDHCAPCLQNPPHFTKARSALKYNDASRSIVLAFKHADQTHAVLAFMPWLKNAGAEFLVGENKADIIIPVPLHPWRLMARRYNQAAILAQRLGREVGMPVLVDGLKRIRHTPSQGHLKAGERAKNVSKAFTVPEQYKSRIAGKSIVLIDDVFTTGSTVGECAKMLKKYGAAKVYVLCIARVVKGD